jgi:beta-mannanase
MERSFAAMTTTFRWEQDGRGGVHGEATYFPGTPYEVIVTLPTFADAQALYQAIRQKVEHTRWDARAGLLSEINRIRP